MAYVKLLICFIGGVASATWNHQSWQNLQTSTSQALSNGRNNGQTCDHGDRKDHAIALLQEWVNHHHYEAVEKLYHDIYHHDLPQKRWMYSSTFDEAFTNSNTVPDYNHVENYIKTTMNEACRTDIMKWIEHLAKTHTPVNTAVSTHAPTQAPVQQTHAPTTHAAQTHAPTTHFPQTPAPTTETPTTISLMSVKSQCDPVTFVTALARGTILTNDGAGLCTDNTHSRPEALVLESCNTPSVAKWKKGVKVMGNCKSIPDYTPIAMFSFGTFVQDGSAIAGIITDCTPTGFKIAIQLCGHPVNVYELVPGATDPQQDPENYYVIDF